MPGKGAECAAITTQYCPNELCSHEPARWPVRNRTSSGVAVGRYFLFEIGPVQGWQLVAIGHSIESHALGGRANRLEIRRSQPAETFGNIFNRQNRLQASAF